MTPEPAAETFATPNPVLVRAWRGDILENAHRGAIAIANARGELIESWGAVAHPMLPRSSYKILQALPLVESGAAEAHGLSPAELALACASHNGAAIHTEPVSAWLARLGLGEQNLICGVQRPQDRPAREALDAAGAAPSQLHNNCSGKHAGFLTLATRLGAPIGDYIDPGHPVQKAAAAAISEMSGHDATLAYGVDGCSAPNFAVPLRGLATAMARVADPSGLGTARSAAAVRLREAMAAHPALIAGEGRACTDFIRAVEAASGPGAAVCKTGADGVFTAILPGRGLGVALKIDDGATAAAEAVMAALLVRLGAAPSEDPRIGGRASKPIINRRRLEVGRLEAVEFGQI